MLGSSVDAFCNIRFVVVMDNASIHQVQGIVDFSEDQTQLSLSEFPTTILTRLEPSRSSDFPSTILTRLEPSV